MINDDVRHIIEPELDASEELLWADRPVKLMLTPIEKILCAFMLLWTVISGLIFVIHFFPIQTSYEIKSNGVLENITPFKYALTYSLFLLVGLVMLAFFFWSAFERTRQFYAVTNLRLIIVSTIPFRKIISLPPQATLQIERSGGDACGSLRFQNAEELGHRLVYNNFAYNCFSAINRPKDVQDLILTTFFSKDSSHE